MNCENYKRITDDNGKIILKRYDSKYKVWVTLHFADEDTGAAKYVMETLGNQYIENEVKKAG